MDSVIFIKGRVKNGLIETDLKHAEISGLIEDKKILIIKELFSADEMNALQKAVFEWGETTPHVSVDDFKGNYHSRKAQVSNIQQSPHVFHDYNFNDFTLLPEEFRKKMTGVFEALRVFYNSLTSYTAPLGVIENKPYFHPQLIQYPRGGGFFGRHNHNLLPQKIGFILALSKYGVDYKNGGTCFVVKNELIDIEGRHDIGDLCMWPNDVDHWVKQSTLEDKFNWDSEKGRWVATLAYFDPYGG